MTTSWTVEAGFSRHDTRIGRGQEFVQAQAEVGQAFEREAGSWGIIHRRVAVGPFERQETAFTPREFDQHLVGVLPTPRWRDDWANRSP